MRSDEEALSMTDPLAPTTPPSVLPAALPGPARPLGTRDDPLAFDGALRGWRADPLPPNEDCSEEGRWRYSLEIRRLEAARGPAQWPVHPVGTWACSPAAPDPTYGETTRWFQLRRFELLAPTLLWTDCRPDADDRTLAGLGKLVTVELYAAWIRERGSVPPPLRGSELRASIGAGGAPLVRISDGHHRGAALYRAGVRAVLVWVNLLEALLEAGTARGDADPDADPEDAPEAEERGA
jgi:hypothetical protein